MIYTNLSSKAERILQARTKGQESLWWRKDVYCIKGLEKQKRKPEGGDYSTKWL